MVALTVGIPFLLKPTSVREADAALEVKPWGSLGCICGDRTTVFLFVADASSAEGRPIPKLDAGVGAVRIEATFLSTPVLPLVVVARVVARVSSK